MFIYACYSREMALKVGFGVLFSNMSDWNGIWEKEDEVNDTKYYTRIYETYRSILNRR
jgi:hypothetical protein